MRSVSSSWGTILVKNPLGEKNLGDGPEQFYSGEGVCLASNQHGLDAQHPLSPFGVIPKCRLNVIPEDGRVRSKPSTQKIYIRGRRHAEDNIADKVHCLIPADPHPQHSMWSLSPQK